MNENTSCCGADCGLCNLRGNICIGCNKACGKVFHAPKEAECAKLPCDIILGTRDPNLTEEEFFKTVEDRVNRLKEKTE